MILKQGETGLVKHRSKTEVTFPCKTCEHGSRETVMYDSIDGQQVFAIAWVCKYGRLFSYVAGIPYLNPQGNCDCYELNYEEQIWNLKNQVKELAEELDMVGAGNE